ncbi:MAG: glycine zipper family protein [Actinomycetota bacterium]|nr:glycine zipper family protein [Actinomycetota bacterium]
MTSTTTGVDRRTVASYTTYPEAVQAVDYLSDRSFPVERLTILARGLHLVENVTGRLDYGSAAGRGALAGAFTGTILGFFFGLFDWVELLVSGAILAAYGLVIGAVAGALMGLLNHGLSAGRRDFSSVPRLAGDHYDVVADLPVAEEAVALLEQLPWETGGATR